MSNLHDGFRRLLEQQGVKFKVSKLKSKFIDESEKHAIAAANLYAAKSPSFPLRPSSSLKCGRELYYDLADFFNPEEMVIDPLNFRQRRVFAYGHKIEEFEIGQINQVKGLQVTHQQERILIGQVHGFNITGSIDGIIWDLKKKKPFLMDVKSINRYGFAEVSKEMYPKLGNYAQLNLYMCSPGYRELLENIGVSTKNIKGVLVYSNKDDQSMEWIEVPPSQEVYEATLKRFEQVYEAYKESKLPPRDFATMKFPCSYCKHRDVCQGKEGEESPDQDLMLPVLFNLDLDAAEDDIITTLWRHVGESSTYYYQGKVLSIEKLKTKWKLKVKNATKEIQQKLDKQIADKAKEAEVRDGSSEGHKKDTSRSKSKGKTKKG